MDDTNVGPGMVNHRKHCQCLECAYQNVLAERDGLLSARDDLAESNRRLVAELGDAKQAVIDLNGANAAYVRANGRLHAEVRAGKLLREGLSTLADKASDYFEALEIAHRHLDMAALRVSHPKDAAVIDAALAGLPDTTPAPPTLAQAYVREAREKYGPHPDFPGDADTTKVQP
jgi:hypothetical protein